MNMNRPAPPRIAMLPYRKPTEGRDYWVLDDALPNALAVRERCLAKTDWIEGYPHKPESWPGLRAIPALEPEELAPLEAWVRKATGADKLWEETTADGQRLNHNCVQVVGEGECESRPHTDSRKLCRYAAVLYLNPDVPDDCGTSFYRQRLPNGQLGGNMVSPPHANLVEALGTRFVPPNSFAEDVRIAHRFNRLLVYRSNLIHSATEYWGHTLAEKRMAAVFFWMA
ncbi:DUF6445 family protein [Arenimonas oryziterrae]|uniref:Prolyl 4-hydroxylase alpha subunit Fe(2+) 2OG dioxygenase domain-containing protein n=1 Tax=Arenimonas oryziterrae DSM 21050 = YC6267 TaxID=1121015 RepID=A0A091AWS0_9GAMM|nr:DUF6445 family protein [Arenimonas oryziterrae]KFN44743.1 hypothetical protein N789_01655 [Arenimonas oryziterrae DSM 21050 = YC6267]